MLPPSAYLETLHKMLDNAICNRGYNPNCLGNENGKSDYLTSGGRFILLFIYNDSFQKLVIPYFYDL